MTAFILPSSFRSSHTVNIGNLFDFIHDRSQMGQILDRDSNADRSHFVFVGLRFYADQTLTNGVDRLQDIIEQTGSVIAIDLKIGILFLVVI